MSLQKSAMSIPLTGGIDRKTDKHQLASGQMYTADNVQYIAQKQLSKRYGCVAITTPGGLQGAPFTAIGIRDNVEPVIQGGNVLNRYNTATNLSTSISAPTQGRLDSVAVASSTGNTTTPVIPSNPSCATDGSSYICVAWEEPQTFPGGNNVLYYGVQDLATGNWIVSPKSLTAASGTLYAAPKVIYNSVLGAFNIFFIQNTSAYAQSIQCAAIALTNLGAGAVINTAAAISISNPQATARYLAIDAVAGLTNITYTLAVVVSYTYQVASNQTYVNTFYFDKGRTDLAYTHNNTCSVNNSTLSSPKVAMTICNNVLVCGIQGIIWIYVNGSAATQSFANTIIPTNLGVQTVTGFTNNFVALGSHAGNIYYCATVTSGAYNTLHNVVYTLTINAAGTALNPATTSSTVDPPNNTLSTSILSKPFFNALTNNLYIWIGAGGYADNTVNANAFLTELSSFGSTGLPLSRCLYSTCGNINNTQTQTSPCEVIQSLSPARFVTFLSSATATASYAPSGIPLTFYGNLNRVGFDFQPQRGNQLLPIPQGGLFSTSQLPWHYDGQQVVEAGFSAGPDANGGAGITLTSGGSLIYPATYWYQICFVRRDAYGNITRSAPSAPIKLQTQSGDLSFTFAPFGYTANNTYVEFYRSVSTTSTTAAAPGVLYLIGSVPQGTVFVDSGAYTDTTIQAQPTIYTASGEVENDPPPPVYHMTFGENRAFIIPSDARNQIWYSKPYYPGKQLEWSANFTVNEGANANLFTAVAVLDSNIICFKADSIAYFSGDGPDATGANGGFSSFARLSSDVGCIDPGSLAIVPNGLLFRSRRGIELLGRGLQVTYVGFPVEPLVQAITTIASAVVLPKYTQVRFVPSVAGQPVLVYDYGFNRWSTYSSMASVQAGSLNGVYWWLSQDGTQVFQETPGVFTDNGANIIMTLETPELQLAGIQGWGRAYRMAVLGDFKSSHQLNISFAYDHSPVYQDKVGYSVATQADINAVVSGLVGVSQVGWDLDNPGSPNSAALTLPSGSLGRAPTVLLPPCAEQFRLSRMPRQRMQVCRIMVQDTPVLVSYNSDGVYFTTPLAFGESCAISDITLEFGQKANVAKLGPAGTV